MVDLTAPTPALEPQGIIEQTKLIAIQTQNRIDAIRAERATSALEATNG